ncbi:hypothetical protein AB0K34_10915 [Actinomadura sp. NPDC049382]|uniref:hypothetical protein n=1 Tax=Actinomadura sp. NPDC049382 TaxID=3158220 RepID=UPI003421C118
MSTGKGKHGWPLLVLAAPAFVAVWSGWVGLGTMTGFGKVQPLPGVPGVPDDFTINTAITLPIGVEAYAAYALGTWLSHRRLSPTTRQFARTSAVGALLLGAAGQVAYHLLEVADRTRAPWWITTIVSCLPVVVLGLGATLAHLIRRDTHQDHPDEGGTNSDLDRLPEWIEKTLRDAEPQVTAEVSDPWDQVEPTPGTTPAEAFGTTLPQVEPEAIEGPSRATPSATPRSTISATVGTTAGTTSKGGTKRGPKGGTKRRSRAETKVALQKLIADLDADQIQVKPLAEALGASRRTVRDLLDEMDVRPIPTAGTRQ